MNRGIFLDRDGVINELVWREGGHVTSPHKLEELVYMPGVREAVGDMRKLGYKIFIVTNQPGLYYGDMELDELVKINNAIKYWLRIDEVYAAIFPFRNGNPENKWEDKFLQDYKPASGGILHLMRKYDINPHQSYMVGDRDKDIISGHNADLLTIYCNVDEYHSNLERYAEIKPDFHVKNIVDVAELLKRIHAKF